MNGTTTRKKILVINPNSSQFMTDGLRPLIARLNLQDVHIDFWTGPRGSPPSINNDADATESAVHCLPSRYHDITKPPALELELRNYDAFLVACYSEHPLVDALKGHEHAGLAGKPVIGIFEASVTAALSLITKDELFGIVSTGAVWDVLLSNAVTNFLGLPAGAPSTRFAGVGTTRFNATDLHAADQATLKSRILEATHHLFWPTEGLTHPVSIGAICLGCAGMSGMEAMVREGCIGAIGAGPGRQVKIIDGVLAGTAWLDSTLRWS